MYEPAKNHEEVILSTIFHTGDAIRKHLKKGPICLTIIK